MCEQALYEQTDPSTVHRVGRGVYLGPTFRVVSCDCLTRFDDVVDHCPFCSCRCTTCNGELSQSKRFFARRRARYGNTNAWGGSGSPYGAGAGGPSLCGYSESLMVDIGALVGRALPLVCVYMAMAAVLYCAEYPYRLCWLFGLLSALTAWASTGYYQLVHSPFR